MYHVRPTQLWQVELSQWLSSGKTTDREAHSHHDRFRRMFAVGSPHLTV